MAVIDFFDRGWQINPNGLAYVMDDRCFTFQEIGTLSCRIAHALLRHGFAHEARMAVWSLNDPIAWASVLGVWRAGMAWVPLNPRSATADNANLLGAFDAEAIFFQRGFADAISAIRDQLPRLRLLVCIDGDVKGAIRLDDFIAGQPATLPSVRHGPDDLVMLAPTGGTTGLPKGVMNTNRALQTFVAHFMITCAYGADDRVVNLAAAPMTHTAGVLSLPCSARGGTVVILTRPDAAGVCAAIERHRVTDLFLPPTVIYTLLGAPDLRARDFSSLRYFIYGAAPMSVERLREAIAVFGPVMTGVYGQMEAFASISFLHPEEHFRDGAVAEDARLTSCGRPSPLVRVTIQDADNRPVPTGETGEICVTGDLLMKGYYQAADKTAETIIDGWLHTGDIGHLDAEGFLHITDRKKDMIITGGFNVFPSEVEQVIWAHPAVQDCAVIGVPDEKWGEAVKAVVELKPGAQVDADTLIGLCKEQLGSVKAPKSVDFLANLPRSPNGKVLKKDIRAPYWAGSGRSI